MNQLTPLFTATRNGFTVHYSRLDSGKVLVVTLSPEPAFAFVSEEHFRKLVRGYALPQTAKAASDQGGSRFGST